MFFRWLRIWVGKNQIEADIWASEQCGDKTFYLPDGACKGQPVGSVPLSEIKNALLRLDPRDDEELYQDIQSWVRVRAHFERGVSVTLIEAFSDKK